MVDICEECPRKQSPAPPPLPGPPTTRDHQKGLLMNGSKLRGYSPVSTTRRDLWDRLFDSGYKADLIIYTDNGGMMYAHASVLGLASPVIEGMLKQAKRHGEKQSISIPGVPHDALQLFIRFLYSSCYEKEEMKEYVLHLLVLSHVFVIPELKRMCVQLADEEFLTAENVVDVFQLALLCDAPRLSLICHRMILHNFQKVSTTEAWKVMKKSHPALERELLLSAIDGDNLQKDRARKRNERKIYLQLYEAMEALVHICRDGCRTIGPHDKALGDNQTPCRYSACKGLELLVRHFAGCKLRVPGGCIQCKRMWQLLELHSRLCADSELCKVPLCRNFKEKISRQNKKDEKKWRILVKNILRTKNIGGSSFFSSAFSMSCGGTESGR